MAQCSATTKKGTRCKSPARQGEGTCLSHAPEEARESVGFGGSQPGAGRPRAPRVIDVLREKIEADIEGWLQPLVDGRTADRGVVVGDGEAARVEFVPDHRTRMKATAEALDRAFGKPSQVHDIRVTEEEPEVDREIRELLQEMDARDPKRRAPAHANGNGKVSSGH